MKEDASSNDDYELMKQWFLNHTTDTEGPWRLSTRFLKALIIKHHLPNLPDMTDADLNRIWLRMVRELCPVNLIIPEDYNIEARLAQSDDNKKIIFASGYGYFRDVNKRILHVSDESIALILKLAY